MTPGPWCGRKNCVNEKFQLHYRNRTRDLPACSAVPQPTAPPRASPRCNVTQFIISGNCSTCFRWYLHPSLGPHTAVSTAFGICHTGVVCAPDDGWRYYPKHVEQFPDIINCVKLHLDVLKFTSFLAVHIPPHQHEDQSVYVV